MRDLRGRVATHRRACSVGGILAFAGVVVVVVHSINGFGDPGVSRTAFAHFDATAVPSRFRAAVADIHAFARTHTDGEIFVLREDAAFWYLTTGVRDPLPYDIPEVSDFGSGGEHGVIARLRARRGRVGLPEAGD